MADKKKGGIAKNITRRPTKKGVAKDTSEKDEDDTNKNDQKQ